VREGVLEPERKGAPRRRSSAERDQRELGWGGDRMTGVQPVCWREEGMGLLMLRSLVVSFLWWRGLMRVRTRVLIQVSRRGIVMVWCGLVCCWFGVLLFWMERIEALDVGMVVTVSPGGVSDMNE
jgi:hypothetical protein